MTTATARTAEWLDVLGLRCGKQDHFDSWKKYYRVDDNGSETKRFFEPAAND